MLEFQSDFAGTINARLSNGHSVANIAIGETSSGKKWLTIYLIETEPEYRRQGEATKLIRELRKLADKNKMEFAAWCPMNEAAENLFKKEGVEIV